MMSFTAELCFFRKISCNSVDKVAGQGRAREPSVRLREEASEIENELALDAESDLNEKAPCKQKFLFARGFEGKNDVERCAVTLLLLRLIAARKYVYGSFNSLSES